MWQWADPLTLARFNSKSAVAVQAKVYGTIIKSQRLRFQTRFRQRPHGKQLSLMLVDITALQRKL